MSSSTTQRTSIDTLDSALSPGSQYSGYPFPRQDGAHRALASGRSSRRHTSVSSVSSITSPTASVGGSLDIQPLRKENAAREISQNAIANLLQPPIMRTGLLPAPSTLTSTQRSPTTRDIPPVTLTNIPHVEPSAFRDYLLRIGPLFESFQRGRAQNETTSPQVFSKNGNATRNDQVAGKAPREQTARPIPARQNSAVTLSPAPSPAQRRRSSGYARRRANEPTPLSTVPDVYFEEEFHLENPRTFDTVSERAEIVRPPPGTPTEEKHANGTALPPRKALATNAILQEKLSWYMDTVEVHLINSISSASTSFFAALGSLRDLQQEASESVERIQKLRADLAALDQGMAVGGLDIVRARQRRENVRKLGQATDQVQRIVNKVMECEELADEGRYEAAADGIVATERLIAGEEVQRRGDSQAETERELMDLRGLHALQGLTPGIRQLQYRIGRGFEARFLETLLSDLRQHIEKVPQRDTVLRWASSFQRSRGDGNRIQQPPSAYLNTSQQLRQDLLSNLNGLSRTGHASQATAAFKEAVMKEMKGLIRKHLPSSSDDDTESTASASTRAGKQLNQQEKSAILARNLRAIDDDDAEALLLNIYTGVSEALRRLSVQVKVLLDVSSSFSGPSSRAASPEPSGSPRSPRIPATDGQLRPPRSPTMPSARLQDELVQALDMSSLLGQAVDVAQTQASRVLKVRAEQTHHQPLERFLRYFTINRLFADECEAISGRSGQVLKNIVNTQLNAFVQSHGDTETQNIAQQLDADQWDAKDFQDKDSAVLSRIVNGMNADSAVWTKGTRVWEESSDKAINGKPITNGTSDGAAPAGKAQVKAAYIDETRYILVQSAINLLPIVDSFMALIASIPSIAPIAIPALVEVLRTFNSRSSQLILGAGATRIAGLKNITTKHLALASQALSFIIALIPYMRESAKRHTGARVEALGEFDKVKRLYQDHQMGIHDKLVEIMTARAAAHIKDMRRIDFDTLKGDEPNRYAETLTKETGTLHRVLSRHLTEPDVHSIMSQISRSYKEQWSKAFSEVRVETTDGKERLLKDAQLFDARLGKIDGFGDIGRVFVEQVKGKTVAVPTAEAAKTTDVKQSDKSTSQAVDAEEKS